MTGTPSDPVADQEFSFSFAGFMRVLTAPMAAGPHQSHITVTADELQVGMGVGGWMFSARVPRSSIVAVARSDRRVWGWGAHGVGGRWLVNGSSRGLVQLSIEPTGRARCLGVPVKLRQLTLSLDEPDQFIEALQRP